MRIPNLEEVWHELYEIVIYLASSSQSIQDKIGSMYNERFWVLKNEIFDVNLNEYFQLLEKKLRHSNNHTFSDIVELEKEDPKNLSDEQCERICKTLVDMFEFISRDYKLESITEEFES